MCGSSLLPKDMWRNVLVCGAPVTTRVTKHITKHVLTLGSSVSPVPSTDWDQVRGSRAAGQRKQLLTEEIKTISLLECLR